MDVAIRDAMVAAAGEGDFFERLRQTGASAVEVQVDRDMTTPFVKGAGGVPLKLDRDPEALKRAFDENDARISAFLLNNDFSAADGDDQVEWAVRAIQAAMRFGVPVVRIDPLARDKSLPRSQVLDNFVRRTARVLERTGGSGVDLAVENHGPMANDPDFLDSVFSQVPNPRLGLTLDTGNFYWYGFALRELYELFDRYAPHAKHTHVKNINYPPELAGKRRDVGVDYGTYCCPLDEGNIDLNRVADILRRAGYDRDLCVENESLSKFKPEERLDVLRRDVRVVRQAIG